MELTCLVWHLKKARKNEPRGGRGDNKGKKGPVSQKFERTREGVHRKGKPRVQEKVKRKGKKKKGSHAGCTSRTSKGREANHRQKRENKSLAEMGLKRKPSPGSGVVVGT